MEHLQPEQTGKKLEKIKCDAIHLPDLGYLKIRAGWQCPP